MGHAGRVVHPRQKNAGRIGENGAATNRQTVNGIDLRRDLIGRVRQVPQATQQRSEIRRHRAVENVTRALEPRLGNVERLVAQVSVGQYLDVRLGEEQAGHA